RTVPRIHPYAAVERSCSPMSPVPESGRRSVGDVPLAPRVSTLLVSGLQAHLQRSHADLAPPEQAVAGVLEPRDLPVRSLVCVPAPRERTGWPCPHELALGLVAAQCRRGL